MKVLIGLAASAVLLGACSTPVPPPGTAAFDRTSRDYIVRQNGATHTLSSALASGVSYNGVSMNHWASNVASPSGYSYNMGLGTAVFAAGLDNGTYFAGISGTHNTPAQTTGTATYTGAYGFVVNGADQSGPLALTADFTAGTLVDTTAGINVSATISGANIDGTVTIGGQTGTLKGGFYGISSRIGGVAVGPRMAGIIATY